MIDNNYTIKKSSDNVIYLPNSLFKKAESMGLFEEGEHNLSLSDLRLLLGD
tara:strand:- start:3104 stop:3256 length:153 start_codon:yes stop_codon:yes gene_type:complete